MAKSFSALIVASQTGDASGFPAAITTCGSVGLFGSVSAETTVARPTAAFTSPVW